MGLYKRTYKNNKTIWWVSFTDSSGKRVRRSTETSEKKEAEGLEAKWKLEAFQEKQWDKEPERSFDELILAYLDSLDSVKPSSWLEEIHFGHFYNEFSGMPLSAIDSGAIDKYIKTRLEAKIGPGTINRELTTLSVAFNYGIEEKKWSIHNPVKKKKLPEPDGRVRWITHEEASDLVKAVDGSNYTPHMADFIRLALNTGCRSGELLGLEWSRVDLQSKMFVLEAEHTKSRKRRSVPLNQVAYEAILGRKAFIEEHCHDSPWVFSHLNGNQLKSVKTAFRLACKKSGIKDFRIHDLRHTCAAWLVQTGVPLPEIRDLLGHHSIKMTEKYAHLKPDNIRKAVSVLDALSRFGHVDVTEKSKA
jgi:integrase